MALLAAGSALVAGGFTETTMQLQTQKVRVLRTFYFDRKAQKVGAVVELPKIFAIEVRAANKAEFVDGHSEDSTDGKGGRKLV